MKFRYYIQDPFEGSIVGTDDDDVAKNYAICEDYYVIDTQTGEWVLSDLSRIEVEEAKNEH